MIINPSIEALNRLANIPEIFDEVAPEFDREKQYISLEKYYSRQNNIALQEGLAVMLFPFISEGIYDSHFLFHKSMRGRAGLLVARKMLNWVFSEREASVIRGYPSRDNRAVRTFGYALGYRQTGISRFSKGVEFLEYELRREDG